LCGHDCETEALIHPSVMNYQPTPAAVVHQVKCNRK